MASLELRKTSKWWYARYQADGRNRAKNLNVEVRGVRPDSLQHLGSAQFENSRVRAQVKLDEFLSKLRSQSCEEELA